MATTTTGTTTAIAVTPAGDREPLFEEPLFDPLFDNAAGDVEDEVAADEAVLDVFPVCDGVVLTASVTVMTLGNWVVDPELTTCTVDVMTAVVDGGAEGAVYVDVVAAGAGEAEVVVIGTVVLEGGMVVVELAGGAADELLGAATTDERMVEVRVDDCAAIVLVTDSMLVVDTAGPVSAC